MLFALGVLCLTIFGSDIAPYNPEKPTNAVLLPPSLRHLMGTDADGIDVFSRVIAAFHVDAFIALSAVSIATVGGILVGSLAGYSFGGNRVASIVSGAILRLLDFAQAVPVFILALALVGTLGPSETNVIIAVTFVNLPFIARLTRTSVRSTEALEFVSACRALGQTERRIFARHIIPNSVDSSIASASAGVGQAVLLTAGLSFLGAGIRPPTPEWGAEIAEGANYVITGQWWIGLFPGLVLALVVVGFALSGDAIRLGLREARGAKGSPPVVEIAFLPSGGAQAGSPSTA
jgi:peptide/nickel transport system permease protein